MGGAVPPIADATLKSAEGGWRDGPNSQRLPPRYIRVSFIFHEYHTCDLCYLSAYVQRYGIGYCYADHVAYELRLG